MGAFTIFPAIDLRFGQVVRLTQGDPDRQKTYSQDPASVAQMMLDTGARWLHVVNLDGAFGSSSNINLLALQAIIKSSGRYQARVQFGGGLHSIELTKEALSNGVSRVVLGSLAVKDPGCIQKLLQEYQEDQLAVSLDSINNNVMVSGWRESTDIGTYEMADVLKSMGLRWLVYTDIKRDGMQSGSNFETTISLFKRTKLNVIASGGVSSQQEVEELKKQGVAGAIVGRALYERTLNLQDLLATAEKELD
jgi:phosphoribosylformimino-5-aminoimidazole carboxamide ribotide isomerase